MLLLKFCMLRSDNAQPPGAFGTEFLERPNRLAIIFRKLDKVFSTWARRGKKPTAPLAIIDNDRITEDGCHRDYKVVRLTYLAQGQSQFIVMPCGRIIHSL